MQATQTHGPARAVPLLTAALAALLLLPPALAQEKTPAKPPAKTMTKAPPKSKANLMTRDELRACMNEQDRLQAIRTRIDQEQGALDQQKSRVQAMDADRQKRAAALDPADEAGRKAVEDEAAKRDLEADAYNARLAALREQVAGFDKDRNTWVERCTTKDFDEMDEAAIKKERARAARAQKK
ncbi:MAG: hypothetical protein ACM3O5_04055 [Betaproteobacteria bacterium]